MEYAHLLKEAADAADSNMRTTLIGAYVMSQLSSVSEGFNKPFNPLLGETYELQTDEFRFIAE